MKPLKFIHSHCTAFIIHFFWCAFVITISFELFFNNIELPTDDIFPAAVYTFFNVVFITLALTAADAVHRKLTVDRPVKEIQTVLNRLQSGDYTARIPDSFINKKYDKFGEIAKSINLLADELSGVETLRTDFISNVSHELKTPLAVIQNYGTILQTPQLDSPARIEYAKSINNTCRKLSQLITNILKLNKLENQQIYPTVSEYDLSAQLAECLIQFENEWEKKNIDIDINIPDEITVRADAELLSLVWNNLLSNAFKFTNEGGTVKVKLTSESDYIIVEISDTGCGISPEVGARIFDKFYQGDTSHATQGNGLGLALVKRVVDIMQGEITVESICGKGSTFAVKLRRQ